jgi:hypothetical protein
MPLRNFLLIYDVDNRCLVRADDLGGDGRRAADRYAEVEAEYRDRQGFEIVLLGADSLETIKVTHSHYFQKSDDDAFADLLEPEPTH